MWAYWNVLLFYRWKVFCRSYKRHSLTVLSSSCRLCSPSAAWQQVAIAAAVCVAAVTVAVVNVNLGHPWTRNLIFTFPLRILRPRWRLMKEVTAGTFLELLKNNSIFLCFLFKKKIKKVCLFAVYLVEICILIPCKSHFLVIFVLVLK